jgi:hypothetical protein
MSISKAKLSHTENLNEFKDVTVRLRKIKKERNELISDAYKHTYNALNLFAAMFSREELPDNAEKEIAAKSLAAIHYIFGDLMFDDEIKCFYECLDRAQEISLSPLFSKMIFECADYHKEIKNDTVDTDKLFEILEDLAPRFKKIHEANKAAYLKQAKEDGCEA